MEVQNHKKSLVKEIKSLDKSQMFVQKPKNKISILSCLIEHQVFLLHSAIFLYSTEFFGEAIIKISIFINSDVIKKELNGLIIKRIIRNIDTKEHKQTFLVTSVEESIFII